MSNKSRDALEDVVTQATGWALIVGVVILCVVVPLTVWLSPRLEATAAQYQTTVHQIAGAEGLAVYRVQTAPNARFIVFAGSAGIAAVPEP